MARNLSIRSTLAIPSLSPDDTDQKVSYGINFSNYPQTTNATRQRSPQVHERALTKLSKFKLGREDQQQHDTIPKSQSHRRLIVDRVVVAMDWPP